jgi:phospholipid/cholesterol/gamma-HCH transport system substrate-binding protein
MITTSLTRRVLVALAGLAVLVGLFSVGVRLGSGGFDPGYQLTATFDRILQGLTVERSDVKMRGVTVGRVEEITLQDDGTVAVTMFIQPEYNIPDTTAAAIEPLSVFGPKFVRLDPGANELTGPYLSDGDVITETEPPVDFLDFVSHGARLLEVADPRDIFTTINTLAEGLEGMGGRLDVVVDSTETIAERSVGQASNIRALLGNISEVSSALAARGEAIVSAARDSAGPLAEISDRPDELADLLDQTSRLSSVLAGLLEDNPGALEKSVVGLSNVVEVIHDDIPGLIALVEALDSFFGNLGRTVNLEVSARPDVRLAVLETWITAQVCALVDLPICNGVQGSAALASTGHHPEENEGPFGGALDPLLDLMAPLPLSDALLLFEGGLLQ